MTPLPTQLDSAPIRVGVSACLLGQEVRWDGGHKRDRFLTDVLGRFVEWVPVCPELELGMGVPRPAVRLEWRDAGVRMLEVESGRDHTRAMRSFARKRVAALRRLDLCGYVLKARSPSCGMERVKVTREGRVRAEGRGLLAERLLEVLPLLPVEEEGRLDDARLRENFIERVFAYGRLRTLFQGRWTRGDVVGFHTAHELQLMAHSPTAVRALGRLLAERKKLPRGELRALYRVGFMETLARRATPTRHTQVLDQLADQLCDRLAAEERTELSQAIQQYRRGRLPLLVPLVLVRHHARRLQVDSLLGQHYLDPHPKELMLRNRV